jgi:hypothetical protein
MIEQDSYDSMFEDRPIRGLSAMERREELANMLAEQNKPAESPNNAALDALTKQILGSSNTSKWTGVGRGSAEANARDMAKIMADIGITDIKQFGPITRQVEQYVGSDDSGNPIYETQTENTFGNKETGQAVPLTYGGRQGGNFFGGTYEGKGNTGYGVQFDPQGNPIFYTQGASSNDLVNLFQDNPILGAVAQVAAASFGGPAGSAALAAAMGKNPKDILKSAALSYAGNQAANLVSGSGAVTDLLGKTGTNIAANTAKQVVGSGGKVDPVQALLGNVLDTGVNSLSTVLPDVGGFIPEDLKGVANTVAKAAISGKPIDQAVAGYLTGQALNSSKTPSSSSGVDKTTIGDFEDTEITRLQKLGYTKDQIKEYFNRLENLTGAFDDPVEALPVNETSPSTSSLSDNTQVEEADDFLKSIGINTLDKAKDSGLSNKDIEDMISGGNELIITGNRDTVGRGVSNDILRNLEDVGVDPNELVITTNRDTVGRGMSNDILRNLEDAGVDPNELIITTNRDTVGGGMSNDILRNLEDAGVDPNELIITTNRDTVGGGMSNDILRNLEDAGVDPNELIITGNKEPNYLRTDDDFPATPIKDEGELVITTDRDKTQEHVFDPTFGGTKPSPVTSTTPTTPVVKPGTPAVKPGTPAVKPTTQTQTNPLDLMSLFTMLSPGQQAPQMPRQKNSAEIELMKDIFGSTLNFD